MYIFFKDIWRCVDKFGGVKFLFPSFCHCLCNLMALTNWCWRRLYAPLKTRDIYGSMSYTKNCTHIHHSLHMVYDRNSYVIIFKCMFINAIKWIGVSINTLTYFVPVFIDKQQYNVQLIISIKATSMCINLLDVHFYLRLRWRHHRRRKIPTQKNRSCLLNEIVNM